MHEHEHRCGAHTMYECMQLQASLGFLRQQRADMGFSVAPSSVCPGIFERVGDDADE